MFTYICLGTNDMQRAIGFYDPIMRALGQMRCDTGDEPNWDGWVGWGRYEDHGQFELALWICPPFNQRAATVGNGTMIAFKADSRRAVREFHEAALQNGGSSEGSPDLRPQYGEDFYAAYVRDPDGNKLAAVCRGHRQEP